jgi:hypothetical protein
LLHLAGSDNPLQLLLQECEIPIEALFFKFSGNVRQYFVQIFR